MQLLLNLAINQRVIHALLTPFYFLQPTKKLQLRLAMLVMSVGMMSGVVAQATVTSDKPDYAPRSNAVFTGSGFAPGETVTLKVKNLSRACNTIAPDSSYLPWTVTADGSGTFVTNWTVCDCNGDSLRLRAIGLTSNDTAYTYFTDRVFQSVVVGAQTGTATANTANSVTYLITVNTASPGSFNNITFTVSGLPSSASASFAPSSINASNATPSPTTTLTISTTSAIGGGSFPFTVTASQGNGSNVTTMAGNGTLVIAKVASTIIVTGTNLFTFNGSPQGPSTSSVTGSTGTVTYSYSGSDNVGSSYGPSATKPTLAGSYNVIASVAGDDNHNGASSAPLPFTIGKTSSVTTVTINGGPFFYTSSTITPATVSVTGAGGIVLATPTAVYVNNTNSGTAIASYNYAGDANHEPSSDSKTFVIGKATATVTVNSYNVTYDGQPHTSTYSITGVNGESGAAVGTINVSATTHTNAGTYNGDAWSFTGSSNYNDANGTVNNVIGKASATVNVTGYTGTYDGASHGATGTATGVGGVDLAAGLNLGATFTNVPGGTASWTFSGGTNYNDQSGSVAIVINKANATVTVTPYNVMYDGQPHTSSYTITGVNGETGATVGTINVSATTHTNAGTYNGDAWSFTGSSNYNDANGTVNNAIGKATATVTVTPYSVTYDGQAHTSTYSITGVNGESGATVGAINVTATTHTNAGTYNSDAWSFTGSANYNDANGTVNNVIGKATATITVTAYNVTYDGQAHTSSYSITGANGETGATVGTINVTATTHTNAGTYNSDAWSFTGSSNYNDANGTVNNVIGKATATVTVNPYNVTYDGTSHTSTYSISGVNGESGAAVGTINVTATTHTNAGTYNNDAWSFTGSSNYNDGNGTVNNVINKANATVNVTGYTGVYDGNAHGATGTATGVSGESLAGLNLGSSYSNVPGGTANWTFNGGTNYNDQNGAVAIVINKADATITVNPYTVVYDGNSHSSTGAATGVNAESLTGLDLSGTAHTNAGTYVDSWTFTDATGNYNNASGTVTNKINKAASATVVTIVGGPFTYTGSAITPAIVSVTGAGGVVLTAPTASYANNINAGTATASYNYAGDTNHEPSSDSKTFVIGKATPVVTVTPYNVTYDGQPHTSTYSITGVNGESGATVGTISVSATTHTNAGTYNNDAWSFTGTSNYNDANGTVNNAIGKATATVTVTPYSITYDGTSHTSTHTINGVNGETGAAVGTINVAATTHTNAGTYNNDAWSFTGSSNYNDANGTVNNVIGKATATVTVTPYSVTYDGLSHTSTYSITGVNGETGAIVGTINVSSTTHTNAGTYNGDAWSFTGSSNYNDANGTVNNTISKAMATVTVTPYSVTYDGQSHTSTYSITGVNGETGATVGTINVSATTHTNAGIYNNDAWSFTGSSNYNDATGTVNNVIDKATATITVTPYNVTYDGLSHTSTYSITGVNGESGATVGTINVSSTTHTNAGTYNGDAWIFTGSANYNDANGTVNNVIGKANATVNVTGYTGIYDGNAHGATGTATGVLGESLAGLNLGASYTNVPGGTANWTFNGGTNYNNQNGTAAIVINQKPASVTPGNASKFCGQADPVFTGVLSGFIAGDGIAATYSRAAGETGGSSYPISATLSPTGKLGNYSITYNTGLLTINTLSIDVSASSNPVPVGSNAVLTASINPVAANITVTFKLDGVVKGTGITNASGVATLSVPGLATDVYKVEAVAGTGGCTSPEAYLPVYDPTGNFVTGGGWINSPAGALAVDPSVVGKANFGFVSKYKKGSSAVEGNTEFQFNAGDINFKSTMHESGSLVVSGAKATYRGSGTINGLAGYKFTIVAVDGNWNNGAAPDKFRIKITTTNGQVIYDNQMGKDENADDATVLGGGSIVIHDVKKKTSNRMDPGVLTLTPQSQEFTVKVFGNPSLTTFRLQLQSSNIQEKFTVKVVDVNGRLIEVLQNLYPGQVIELGSKYTQGTYFAEVTQGTNRKLVKLVKTSRDR